MSEFITKYTGSYVVRYPESTVDIVKHENEEFQKMVDNIEGSFENNEVVSKTGASDDTNITDLLFD